ncbi:MAG: hypothetical protein SFU53_12705 [Terrimicrobiaceae bacterium]|nr:hypothetical protein [Terrimicrobiaceae bacterium]
MKTSSIPQLTLLAALALLSLSGCISVEREEVEAPSTTTTTRTSTLMPTSGSTTVERTTVY